VSGGSIDAVYTTHRLFGVGEPRKRQVRRFGDRSRATGITVEIDGQQDSRIDAGRDAIAFTRDRTRGNGDANSPRIRLPRCRHDTP